MTDIDSISEKQTSENTIIVDEADYIYKVVDKNHRHYDHFMESGVAPGTRFPAVFSGVAGARRRQDSRLGVSRIPLLEMSGGGREGFYQQRLLLSLAWWCSVPVKSIMVDSKEVLQWTFQWSPPSSEAIGGASLEPEVMTIATSPETAFSFEERCKQLEVKFGDPELDVACSCCASEASNNTCESCMFCIGWHRCNNFSESRLFWKVGTLHAGHFDIQRMLLNMHRRQIPTSI